MKRVLIITYYWPPAGGGGVMRWLKMSKYLKQDTSWEPTIFCPEDAQYLVQDESLYGSNEIDKITQKIIEPNNVLKALGFKTFVKGIASGGVGNKKSNKSLVKKVIIWIRSNIFIPDARFLWIKPSIKKLSKELKEQNFDAIISTGPPHSTHLIALGLKKKFNIPWIADFRDPWTFIDFFEDLDLTESSRRKHHNLEKTVVEGADAVVTVSNSWANQFKEIYNRNINVITNGYDPADYSTIDNNRADGNFFSLIHIGSLNKDRNSPVFWDAVSDLCKEDKEFSKSLKIELIGSVTPELYDEIIERHLQDNITIINHLPHNEVLNKVSTAHVSLLFINNTSNKGGIIPGKLYEYLAIRNPILCIGNKNGDSAKIINETNSGYVIGFEEREKLKEKLKELFDKFKEGNLEKNTPSEISNYSRQTLAHKYSDLLDKISS